MATKLVLSDRATWLKGPPARCSTPPRVGGRVWRLVLLGAPGVGKGTQAELLNQRLGACHLSTGDVFRAARSLCADERSPAMEAALGYMTRGELVPDSTVLELIRERSKCVRCAGGFLLDGFPRTSAQAEALGELLMTLGVALDGVIDYRLPIDQIVDRLSGRRTCSGCKAVYHVAGRPPRIAGVCDACGEAIVQREDDRPEAVRVRMEAYARSTAPLTRFYERLELLVPIDASGTPQEIFQRTHAALLARVEGEAIAD